MKVIAARITFIVPHQHLSAYCQSVAAWDTGSRAQRKYYSTRPTGRRGGITNSAALCSFTSGSGSLRKFKHRAVHNTGSRHTHLSAPRSPSQAASTGHIHLHSPK
ncbi:hypothetical protein PFLUV_G00266290 [Perca fluviatilis]|uniref:Uncharacterized protein n=1 Tax=Perca fluviatilis TaxID=8168 RepID=A0A6A5DUT4_PERFL|nr:hypothetical protein PFLUV_G00266290 [Perca fluviatilis]